MKRHALVLLLCCALAPGCTLVDIRTDAGRSGVKSDGFISGYATYGWSDQDSLLEVEVLGGRSPGSILKIDLWKIAQVELGLLGASAGIGPLNAGLGILFYEPRPPFEPRVTVRTPPAPPAPPEPPPSPAPPGGG
jgi:hypothetical protein